jgi:hypothetical protein
MKKTIEYIYISGDTSVEVVVDVKQYPVIEMIILTELKPACDYAYKLNGEIFYMIRNENCHGVIDFSKSRFWDFGVDDFRIATRCKCGLSNCYTKMIIYWCDFS